MNLGASSNERKANVIDLKTDYMSGHMTSKDRQSAAVSGNMYE